MRPFDLDKYLRASRKLDLEGIDIESAPAHPLSRTEVRVLTYMMDIETHTIIYLRDLLSTRAAEDPDVTAFLSLWVYEEFWHGEALGRFLRAAGERIEPGRTSQIRRAASSGIFTAVKGLVAHAVPEFIPLHMTWGALNEISTLNGYQRMIARTRHPVLASLLTRIAHDERRHFAFYFNQARMRLAADARAQRLVRWALDRFWQPVGTGVRPQQETDFVISELFGDEEGARVVRGMEHELSKLPGLGGMRIMSRAREAALRRSAPTRARGGGLQIAAQL